MLNRYRWIYLAWISLVLLACSAKEDGLPETGARGGGFGLVQDQTYEQIIERFKEKDIPYEVNSRGFTIYMLKDQAEVLGIIRDVQNGGVLKPNSLESEILHTKSIKALYIKMFEEAGIPYFIDTTFGYERIVWRQLYGPEVDRIRQWINEQRDQLSPEEAVEKGLIPAHLADDWG